MPKCLVCASIYRDQIEKDLMDMPDKLDEISAKWDISKQELLVHSCRHMATPSIAAKSGIRESSYLTESILKSQEIMSKAAEAIVDAIDEEDMNRIPKQIVDLYLGSSKEVRENVDELVKINQLLNGPKDAGFDSLARLVDVLRPQA